MGSIERELTLFKRRERLPLRIILSIIHLWSSGLAATSCWLERIAEGILVQDFLSLLSSSWRIALYSPYSYIEFKHHPSSSAQFQLEIVHCCWVLLGRFSTTPSLACFFQRRELPSLWEIRKGGSWYYSTIFGTRPTTFHHMQRSPSLRQRYSCRAFDVRD